MRPWNEIITEARDRKKEKAERERRLRMAKTNLKGSAALDKGKKTKKEKYGPGDPHFDLARDRENRKAEQLKFSIEQSKKSAEEKKKKALEDIKNKPRKAASSALSDIKTQTISSKDKDATAYTKAVGNVASLVGGVAKAGINYGIAKYKAKKAAAELEKGDGESKIPEKKPKKSGPLGGRPTAAPSGPTAPSGPSGPSTGPTGPSGPSSTGAGGPRPPRPSGGVNPRKRLVPSTKRLPSADGGTSKSLGQQARENPELRKKLMNQRNEEYSNWREEFIVEVEDKEGKLEKKKIIDVLPSNKPNKIEINPNIKEEKDEEGGMAHNELATMERAVKTLRKKIKSPNQQLPAWVQSKISKAADYIDSVSDYMSGETEPVTEECGDQDSMKKILAMMIIKKVVDAKKKKNFQLNSGIIGEAKSPAWQRKEGKSDKGGLNEKGRKSYERENPGSDLKAPQPKGGSRRDSFCARMSGMKRKLTSAKTANDPNSRINKSLRAWNC